MSNVDLTTDPGIAESVIARDEINRHAQHIRDGIARWEPAPCPPGNEESDPRDDLDELLERHHLTRDQARVMLGHLYREGESR